MSVTYTAVLPVRDETADFLAKLLADERLRRGTRAGTRSLSCHDQAVLVLRWFLDGTRMSSLLRAARDQRRASQEGAGHAEPPRDCRRCRLRRAGGIGRQRARGRPRDTRCAGTRHIRPSRRQGDHRWLIVWGSARRV